MPIRDAMLKILREEFIPKDANLLLGSMGDTLPLGAFTDRDRAMALTALGIHIHLSTAHFANLRGIAPLRHLRYISPNRCKTPRGAQKGSVRKRGQTYTFDKQSFSVTIGAIYRVS